MSHELGNPVLVVHSDAGVRHVIAEALALEGIAAAAGAHGDALTALGRQRPGMVLLDLDGDCTAFRQALTRQHGGEIPIVGMSMAPLACDSPGLGEDVKDVLLRLPFELDDLVGAVGRFCATN